MVWLEADMSFQKGRNGHIYLQRVPMLDAWDVIWVTFKLILIEDYV